MTCLDPQRKPAGKVLDELIQNPRRLGIAHFWLGMMSAFVYWLRPGTFVPYIHWPRHGEVLSLIFQTFIAWAPYILSVIVSRAVLSARAVQATFVFIACSAGITAGAAGLYFNVLKMAEAPSPLVISTGVAVALVLVCAFCALIWKSDVAD
jgi:hypothetical protein